MREGNRKVPRPARANELFISDLASKARSLDGDQTKMAVSGTLAVKVHRLEAAEGGEPGEKLSIRLAVGDNERHTKFMSVDNEIDEILHYNVQRTAESEEVTIEVLQQDQTTPLVSAKRTLREFMEGFQSQRLTFTFGSVSSPKTMYLIFSADWTQSKKEETTLAPAGTHRPWFMRASYYYETSKNVYDYTTSFRVVKPFARLGEATVNTVLATVTGKTLFDVDQSLVVPVLDSVDNKVDVTISVAFTKLYEGQQFAVKTKNKAVNAVSNVAHKTGNTAVRATNYTTNKVASATGAVYGAVTGTADYASSQVKNASSSTYGAVRGVTYSVASHIPLLGPKIRA
ncbi:hypothetical protein PC129_g16713 [Phytophthora cactorum]|uniref:Uncharacterized protein n=2 Tax=Phytophthora cactorum TaxID=29920 RepID=A0A8T1K137_9STRA|nr:hypothetical protein Pcac1_g16002 [Phytophthora cactorum]KAG2800908.1 hypothetical protein PC112_g20271 [Phytophthora cactorum]KAG2807044.1 hypothetical protein PC111_g17099 [Phytophthora cactorum]KAG2851440.1 hypothetical protein PC113_g15904 [Phytophthora cactorum]KAG2885347.1 hypothetical protein PC114_g19720 [Phytophthora cactorum]